MFRCFLSIFSPPVCAGVQCEAIEDGSKRRFEAAHLSPQLRLHLPAREVILLMGRTRQKKQKRWGLCGSRAIKIEPRHIVLHIISAPTLSCRPARKAERSQSVGAADVGGRKGNVTPPPSYATMGRASLPPRPPTYSSCVPLVPPIIDEEPSSFNVESTLPLLPSLPTRERPPSARRLKKRFFS